MTPEGCEILEQTLEGVDYELKTRPKKREDIVQIQILTNSPNILMGLLKDAGLLFTSPEHAPPPAPNFYQVGSVYAQGHPAKIDLIDNRALRKTTSEDA